MLNIIILTFFTLLTQINLSRSQGFYQNEESRFLQTFNTLIKDSYTAPIPSSIKSSCKNQPPSQAQSNVVSIKFSMNSQQLQDECGSNSICIIPKGFNVTMTSSLNVAALVVQGRMDWNDASQAQDEQYICAGYIAVIKKKTK